MKSPSPTFLTVPQTAELLNCSRASVYRGISDGRIPAVQLGGRGKPLRIPLNELTNWVYSTPEET